MLLGVGFLPRGRMVDVTTPDELAGELLRRGVLRVDTGAVWRGSERAEVLDVRSGYGRVAVAWSPLRWAMAHRVVWAAAFGPVPLFHHVGHIDGVRWNNDPSNLRLIDRTPASVRVWRELLGETGAVG